MNELFKIVAHRGDAARAPGNTVAAFRSARDIGADAIELDVRLTRDGVPVVHHNSYVDETLARPLPIWELSAEELRPIRVVDGRTGMSREHPIPVLAEVVEEFAGSLSLEIELKGPEPEVPERVAMVLEPVRAAWDTHEVTSFEPTLLAAMRALCPGMRTALLVPPSEPWMHLDVVAHIALHRARLAQADAVHLHPTQLDPEVVGTIRSAGIEVHAHSINDRASLDLAARLGLPWVCTDMPQGAIAYRREHARQR